MQGCYAASVCWCTISRPYSPITVGSQALQNHPIHYSPNHSSRERLRYWSSTDADWGGIDPRRNNCQSVSHYHTPSRELMAHTHTLLWSSFSSVRQVSLHLFFLLLYVNAFFLYPPSQDARLLYHDHRESSSERLFSSSYFLLYRGDVREPRKE